MKAISVSYFVTEKIIQLTLTKLKDMISKDYFWTSHYSVVVVVVVVQL